MGAANSKVEEDKALRLCSERKKFVRQALDGRCSLAAAHVAYVQSLRNAGTALRKFVEPEGPMESSLYTSTSATPEPLALTEKSVSHFSLSPAPSLSRRLDNAETFSPTPSPPTSLRVNHMKFRGSYSTKVEERPALPMIRTVTSSAVPKDTPHSTNKPETSAFEDPQVPLGTSPWDYFGLSHPIDQLSSQERKWGGQESENLDHIVRHEEDKLIFHEEDENEASVSGTEGSRDSEDEFDEPSTDTLVRRFENLNRVNGQGVGSPSTTMRSATSIASETEFLRDEGNSPDLSPLRDTSSAANLGTNSKKTPIKEGQTGTKVPPKEFVASIRDIEFLFVKASESGGEVPRMLEANKLHFRPILPKRESGPLACTYFRACFFCGEDRRHVQEEPAQATIKYLTWHRTASSRSSSSRNLLGMNPKEDSEDPSASLFDNFCMNSGSHASTLDRLYAWERKLYDEVKASELVRRQYDMKCRHLRQLQSKRERSDQIDRTRAVVKDLYSRIKVAIHRIDSISKRIEELRDGELQPQLEELIEGLIRMWEVMFECHKRQFQIISAAQIVTDLAASMRSESHRQITLNLESDLNSLAVSFVKWINAQKSYLQSIDNWLHKCVSIPQKTTRRRRGTPAPQIRKFGPPIYVTCGVWLETLDSLPTKPVTDSIKALTVETSRFLPRQDKNRGKSLSRAPSTLGRAEDGTDSAVNKLRDDASEDWGSGFDCFRSGLVGFLGQLNDYSEAAVKKYAELNKAIENAKAVYEQFKSQSQQVHEGS
ncbi:protein ROLLING AND ERECT LEAF 2 [Punica granatum]|uniref:Protein ROLLING AND ERECT LEAF 2 n=2 Tax=Punica granatum TaxID=22663 RepID=A0A6P8DUK2_PUNGR|nr:protein ROLLING AND ERECT LEAF 2 [Punica granatum]XP_031401119.1 protein ROLLING AND ERECT LEAF 2 [Punica granatum]XP_031401120.1 protein ROLLING AND ERECT LEAF 2 [Punica granatum]XP_031401121.1 protein ROLLING AND ERECT LEAF 2 [Punica granatum]OWM69083.1 hypothetical protein CDL15_Pgr025270 [Punica granatum]PKI73292.1 hypothetical protein CRG98_006230 [Punica granatum]